MALLDPTELTPHGFCLSWDPALLGLHITSDAVIALAYFTIPIALTVLVNRRRDLAFPGSSRCSRCLSPPAAPLT